MKRIRVRIGDIIEIHVHGKYYCYAQIIPNDEYAFFDFKTDAPLKDFSVLDNCKILFVICVYRFVLNEGIWKIVGNYPVREDLLLVRMNYIYDKHTDTFQLYNPETGEITPATKEMARGLERCSVWGDNHVEDRIDDYYNDRPCIWMKEDDELWVE